MESTPHENAALVQEFLSDVLAGGDLDALDIFLTDTAIEHQPVLEEDSGASEMQSRTCRVLGTAEVDIAIEDVVADGDMVAVRATLTGTHGASVVDATPTGRTFEIAYAVFSRIEDGQIAEIWSIPDGRALQREVGRDDEQCDPDETQAD